MRGEGERQPKKAFASHVVPPYPPVPRHHVRHEVRLTLPFSRPIHTHPFSSRAYRAPRVSRRSRRATPISGARVLGNRERSRVTCRDFATDAPPARAPRAPRAGIARSPSRSKRTRRSSSLTSLLPLLPFDPRVAAKAPCPVPVMRTACWASPRASPASPSTSATSTAHASRIPRTCPVPISPAAISTRSLVFPLARRARDRCRPPPRRPTARFSATATDSAGPPPRLPPTGR